MKVVINACHSGFELSHEAIMQYAHRKGIKLETREGEYKALIPFEYYIDGEPFYDRYIPRDDPDLVATVRELGENANSRFSKLKIVEIPDDVEWEIADYDGSEWVAEKHRTWA